MIKLTSNTLMLLISLTILRLGQCQNLLPTTEAGAEGSPHPPPRELFSSACQVFGHLAPEGSTAEEQCSLMPPLYFEYTAWAGFSPTTVEEKFQDCKR
jgi:hypothetical protein